jgi:hypothetical protein
MPTAALCISVEHSFGVASWAFVIVDDGKEIYCSWIATRRG